MAHPAASTPELVATLGAAVHPVLTATELFFVSWAVPRPAARGLASSRR